MEVTRRELLGGAAATALAVAAGTPAQTQEGPTIRAGLIGCGGRGTGALGNVLEADKNVEVVAIADLFPERVDRCRKVLEAMKDPRVKLTDARCFSGLDAYKRLLDTDVNYVMMAQPPYFRSVHFEAAVEAGKHCWLEKPGAVDTAGVHRLIRAGEKAKAKNLGVHSSTENRHDPRIVATVKQLQAGAVGSVVSARVYFNTGGLWRVDRKPGWSDVEWQIRNWYYFDWLSGDHIVEQHVHELDLCNWVLGANPVRASAVGGRTVRTEPVYGNIWDHFAVDFEYPNGVHVMSVCRQWEGADGSRIASFAGPLGEAELYTGAITGKNAWKFDGKDENPHMVEHRHFIASIRSGKPYNEARQLAESTAVGIMGRTAAYAGKTITWDDLMKTEISLGPPKVEFTGFTPNPVPVPGKA